MPESTKQAPVIYQVDFAFLVHAPFKANRNSLTVLFVRVVRL